MFRKWELLWILPVALIVSLFSVWGLTALKTVKSDTSKMLLIQELKGFNSPAEANTFFCKSLILVDNPESAENRQKFEKVVYDSFYHKQSFVDDKTACGLGQGFINQSIVEGYRLIIPKN